MPAVRDRNSQQGLVDPTPPQSNSRLKGVGKDVFLPVTETVARFSTSHPILRHKICSQFFMTTSILFFKQNEEHTYKS